MPSPATRLALAYGAVHVADQAALVALPIVDAIFLRLEGAELALLAAAQGAGWLLFSFPAGSLADLGPWRSAIRNGLLLAGIGFLLAAPAAIEEARLGSPRRSSSAPAAWRCMRSPPSPTCLTMSPPGPPSSAPTRASA